MNKISRLPFFQYSAIFTGNTLELNRSWHFNYKIPDYQRTEHSSWHVMKPLLTRFKIQLHVNELRLSYKCLIFFLFFPRASTAFKLCETNAVDFILVFGKWSRRIATTARSYQIESRKCSRIKKPRVNYTVVVLSSGSSAVIEYIILKWKFPVLKESLDQPAARTNL